MNELLIYILIGVLSGFFSGLLGIGGATIIIPFLVLILGFDQKTAQGTTLMLMLPPLGLLAALEYYKSGFVNLKAALIIAIFFILSSWIASKLAIKINSDLLRKIFAGFLILISIRMFFK